MTRTTKILLTALSALYLLVALAGLIGLASMGPILAVVALVGMAFNGFMVSDWIGCIWRLTGQYDDGTV